MAIDSDTPPPSPVGTSTKDKLFAGFWVVGIVPAWGLASGRGLSTLNCVAAAFFSWGYVALAFVNALLGG
jgi:hypothetical protein